MYQVFWEGPLLKRGSVIGRCSKNGTHMRSVHVQRHDTAYRRLFFEVQKCVTCLIFEHFIYLFLIFTVLLGRGQRLYSEWWAMLGDCMFVTVDPFVTSGNHFDGAREHPHSISCFLLSRPKSCSQYFLVYWRFGRFCIDFEISCESIHWHLYRSIQILNIHLLLYTSDLEAWHTVSCPLPTWDLR